MKGAVSLGVKNAVIALAIAVIMAQYPYVLSVSITGITHKGGRTIEVKGIVELQRGSEPWTGPENFDWFDAWWRSEEAADRVSSDSRGLITLHSIRWRLVEQKQNSDVLEFIATVTLKPSAPPPPWHKGWQM